MGCALRHEHVYSDIRICGDDYAQKRSRKNALLDSCNDTYSLFWSNFVSDFWANFKKKTFIFKKRNGRFKAKEGTFAGSRGGKLF